jgi:hypothetical protein
MFAGTVLMAGAKLMETVMAVVRRDGKENNVLKPSAAKTVAQESVLHQTPVEPAGTSTLLDLTAKISVSEDCLDPSSLWVSSPSPSPYAESVPSTTNAPETPQSPSKKQAVEAVVPLFTSKL